MRTAKEHIENNLAYELFLGIIVGVISYYSIKLFKLYSFPIIFTLGLCSFLMIFKFDTIKTWFSFILISVLYSSFIELPNYYPTVISFYILIFFSLFNFSKNVFYRMVLLTCLSSIYFFFGHFFLISLNLNRILDGSFF